MSAARSRNMAAIRGKDTKPEMLVRSWVHRRGFRFRLHAKGMPGSPDLVLARHRTVVFVHGCFWHSHGCSNSVVPQTRREFWVEKLGRNVARDAKNFRELTELGWRVFVVWECDLRKHPERTLSRLTARLSNTD